MLRVRTREWRPVLGVYRIKLEARVGLDRAALEEGVEVVGCLVCCRSGSDAYAVGARRQCEVR